MIEGSSQIAINTKDKNGYTPLHNSILRKKVELTQDIIRLGADVNIEFTDYLYSETPVVMAISNANTEMVELLIIAGANVNAQNHNLQTALHIAVQLGKIEMVKLLLSFTARTDIKDYRGNTPLHVAAMNLHADIVQILLENKVEIDAQDNAGNTALHLVLWRDADIAQLLLNKGADTMIKNNVEETALKNLFRFNSILLESEMATKLLKNSLRLYIGKFIEAGWSRFDMLRNELGGNFVVVETIDAMVNKIVAQEEVQVQASIGIIDALYPNAAKMAPSSLVLRLLNILEDFPAGSAAVSATSSQDYIDDEKPPVIKITGDRKRDEMENDCEIAQYNQSTKRLRY